MLLILRLRAYFIVLILLPVQHISSIIHNSTSLFKNYKSTKNNLIYDHIFSTKSCLVTATSLNQ